MRLLVFGCAAFAALCLARPALAGRLHVKATCHSDSDESINLSHFPAIEAYASAKSAFGNIKEEYAFASGLGLYKTGNCLLGSRHAHHHFPEMPHAPVPESNGPLPGPPVPPQFVLGEDSTADSFGVTFVPNEAGDMVIVTVAPESFIQIDLDDVPSGNRLISQTRLEFEGGGLGTLELTASGPRFQDVSVKIGGLFSNVPTELLTFPNGVVALRFTGPATWTVPGVAEDFDIAIDGSTVPEPATVTILGLGAVAVLALRRRDARG